MANVKYIWGTNLARTSGLTDMFFSTAGTVSVDTTTFTRNALKLDMHTGTTAAIAQDPVGSVNIPSGTKVNNYKTRLYLSALPASNLIVHDYYRNGTKGIYIDTAGKLWVSVGSGTSQVSSVSSLSAATEYVIESIYDENASTNGTFKCKIWNSSGTLIEEVSYALASETKPGHGPYLGPQVIKSAVNCILYLWDIVGIWEVGANTGNYMGPSAYPQAEIAVSAVDSYNDSTPSTGSDKLATIDESPSNGDTDYDFMRMTGGPTSAPSVATGAAGVLTGAYKYRVTFVTANGESSYVDSTSATVNPSSQQVNLTNIPKDNVSGTSEVTSRKIYRTQAGGSTYYLLTTIADNTTTTYTDNTADGSLDTSHQPPSDGAADPTKRQAFIFSGSGLSSPTDYELNLVQLSNYSNYRPASLGFARNPGDDTELTDLTKLAFGYKTVEIAGQLDITFELRITAAWLIKITANSDGTGTVIGYSFQTVISNVISAATRPVYILMRVGGAGGASIPNKVLVLNQAVKRASYW